MMDNFLGDSLLRNVLCPTSRWSVSSFDSHWFSLDFVLDDMASGEPDWFLFDVASGEIDGTHLAWLCALFNVKVD
jgi:hypothetical protein